MVSKRKFYRHKVVVEVLSESPVVDDLLADLETLAYEIDEGDWSGQVEVVLNNEELDGKQMADCLRAQGSDPGFFRLCDDGSEQDEDEEDPVVEADKAGEFDMIDFASKVCGM